MSVLVDTSVWSLALRRDEPLKSPPVDALTAAIDRGEACLLGIVLQEVLQGFPGAARTRKLVEWLNPFPILTLDRGDHVYAAEIRNRCRAKGFTIGTVDALIAAAAIGHDCILLTADHDFDAIARLFPLRLA